jgi:hypothetical protein
MRHGTFVNLARDSRDPYDLWKSLKTCDSDSLEELVRYGFPFNEVTAEDLLSETRLCYQLLEKQMTYGELLAQAYRRSLLPCSFGDVLRFCDQFRSLREFCCLMTDQRIAVASRNRRTQRILHIRRLTPEQGTSAFDSWLFLMKVN